MSKWNIPNLDKGERYARVVDHLAVKNVAQGAPIEGGFILHYFLWLLLIIGAWGSVVVKALRY